MMRNPENPMNMNNIAGRNFPNHCPKLANLIAISETTGDFSLPKMDWDHMCPSP